LASIAGAIGINVDIGPPCCVAGKCAVFVPTASASIFDSRPLVRYTSYKMRCSLLVAAALPLAQGIRIVQSNDDGWAEINIRTFFNTLNAAGHQVVLSGPAENQSGTGIASRSASLKIQYIDKNRLF
jgi:hypothetical protein